MAKYNWYIAAPYDTHGRSMTNSPYRTMDDNKRPTEDETLLEGPQPSDRQDKETAPRLRSLAGAPDHGRVRVGIRQPGRRAGTASRSSARPGPSPMTRTTRQRSRRHGCWPRPAFR